VPVLVTGFYIGRYTEGMTKALRGINLGGWLVAERWMTPGLFAGVTGEGEITLVRSLGYDAARARLTTHRDTFITEKDFEWIASQGFDFVRLPVGHWLFERTDDFIDGEVYVERAFEWARRHKLGIVLDFHGLQGSQNGYDHSGQVGKVRLYRGRNTKDALSTLEYMAKTYGQEEALLALELINEPKVRWFLWRLLRYYDRAYKIAERSVRPEVKIIVSDAFKPLRMARALARRNYGGRLVLDVHLYQVFGKSNQGLTLDEHLRKVETEWPKLLARLGNNQPVMVGEWSAALPASAYTLQGLAEGSGAIKFYDAQLGCFDRQVWAHSYWTYKAPGCGVWDYRSQSSFHGK
jgi:glucan 1,3-beta-glucosidase